jgi:hypothetical protein
VEPVDVAPFAPYPQTLVLQVKVGYVARQDFVGAGRGLVEQSPEALLSDGYIRSPEEAFERRRGDGLGAVLGLPAPLEGSR